MNCCKNRKGPPPFTHFIPLYTEQKTRHPQCLVFCFVSCDMPVSYGQIALAALASTTRFTAIRYAPVRRVVF